MANTPTPLPVASSRPPPAPSDFQVSASDAQGHGIDVHFRVPPSFERQMAEIVGSVHFPYKTKTDLLRHALKEHLEWLVTLAPVRSYVHQIAAVNRIMVEEENNISFFKSLEKLGTIVLEHTRNGRGAQALSLVHSVRSEVETMPTDSVWRELYLREIEARWGSMLKNAPTALGGFGVMKDD